MKIPGLKKITPIFSVLAGKSGTKPAGWTGLAIVAEAAAISVGTAVAVCAWPPSAAFFAASLAQTGISSGTNAAGSLGSHKHFAQITELSQKNLALVQKNLELLQSLEEDLGVPQDHEKTPDLDLTNLAIQNGPKEKKLSAFIGVVKGRRGAKPVVWTGLAAAAEAAAIGVSVTVAVGAWPLTAAFFAASLLTTGVSSALNAASAVSNHKHFETITKLEKANSALLEKNLELEEKLIASIKAKKTKPQAAPAPGPR
jgi:hypothetical protein